MSRFLVLGVPFVASTAAYGAPLDFKGIPLGITLEQFRATPHPDGRKALADCTGDKNEGRASKYMRPRDNPEVEVHDKIEQSLGVSYCVFRSLEPLYRGGPTGTLGLDIGSSGTIRYVFKFVPEGGGAARLYEIEAVAPPDALQSIVYPLTSKFGPPVKQSTTVQNLMGAAFDRQTLVWQREGTVLTVQSPAERVNQMSLRYVHEALRGSVDAARRQAEAAKPNRI